MQNGAKGSRVRKRGKNADVLGIHIGQYFIRVVALNGNVITAAHATEMTQVWYRDNTITDAAYLQKTLRTALKKFKGKSIKDVYVALPNALFEQTLEKWLSQKGRPEELRNAMVVAARTKFHNFGEFDVRANPVESIVAEGLLGAVRKSTLEAFKVVFDSEGFKLQDVDESVASLTNILNRYTNGPKSLWATIYLEGKEADIYIYWGRELVTLRRVREVSSEISRQLGTLYPGEPDDLRYLRGAEEFDAKRLEGWNVISSSLAEIILKHLEDTLLGAVQRYDAPHLNEVISAIKEEKIDCVYLTGSGAANDTLRMALESVLPATKVISEPVGDPSFSVAYAVTQAQQMVLDLVPKRTRQQNTLRRIALYSISGLSLAMLIATGWWFSTKIGLQSNISNLQSEVISRQPVRTEAEHLEAETTVLLDRLTRKDQLVEANPDWFEQLARFYRLLPKEKGVFKVGLERISVALKDQRFEYSLTATCKSREPFETFVRDLETNPSIRVVVNSVQIPKSVSGIYRFDAVVSLPRDSVVGGTP